MFYFPRISPLAEMRLRQENVNICLGQLQKELTALVHWETVFNEESNIEENSPHLKMLEELNKYLNVKTPDRFYIISNRNVNCTVQVPTIQQMTQMQNLIMTKVDEFVVNDGQPGQTVIRKEATGNTMRCFVTYEGKEPINIHGGEYLMLTTKIDVSKPRKSEVKYSFIYDGKSYTIVVDNTNPHVGVLTAKNTDVVPPYLTLVQKAADGE